MKRLTDYYYLNSCQRTVYSKRTGKPLKSDPIRLPKAIRGSTGRNYIPQRTLRGCLKYGNSITLDTSRNPKDFYRYDNETDRLFRIRNGSEREVKYLSCKLPQQLQKVTGTKELSRLLLCYWVHTGHLVEGNTVRWSQSQGLHRVPAGFSRAFALKKGSKKLPRGVYKHGNKYFGKCQGQRSPCFVDIETALAWYQGKRKELFGELEPEQIVREQYGYKPRRDIDVYLDSGELNIIDGRATGNIGSARHLV